ncbi:MAG: DUF1995 family protein [Okeania sp. SIO2C2]|uniref:DUF1995 family protein n=1 Tax=Okeania sp. SIO2C2 TaxID=2607787 RepID=UPI0013BB263B|nr:DUF1995 family protein [Okeania sp. SIO2C2]NEP89190.1 DUF1995 family protein [Okeania sp. SIO2C2]
MNKLPNDIDEALTQAIEATKAALQDGYSRIQIEIVIPEIELQAQSLAAQFIPALLEEGIQPKVFFPDTGAAALARRDWQDAPFEVKVEDIGTSRSPVDSKIAPEDEFFLLVALSSVEVAQAERLCNLAGDRPVVMLIPRLEDVSIVGIGYAARQLRERFLKTIESCYYIKSFGEAALYRCYPSPWQVWLEENGQYKLIAERSEKPMGDTVEMILAEATTTVKIDSSASSEQTTTKPKRKGFLTEIQKFLRALSN